MMYVPALPSTIVARLICRTVALFTESIGAETLLQGLSEFQPVDDTVVGGVRHVIDAAAHSGFTDWKTVDFVTYRCLLLTC